MDTLTSQHVSKYPMSFINLLVQISCWESSYLSPYTSQSEITLQDKSNAIGKVAENLK